MPLKDDYETTKHNTYYFNHAFFYCRGRAYSFPPGEIPLQLGVVGLNQGESQFVGIQNAVGNRYTVNSSPNTSALLGIGYFVPGPSKTAPFLDLGLNVFYIFESTVKGTVVQELVNSNLAYQYDVTHIPIYAMAKTHWGDPYGPINLIADAGIGVNILKTSDYKESELFAPSQLDNAFSGETSTQFSATLGAGLRLNKLFDGMPVDISYRYFYLGKGELNKNNNQIVNNLSTGNIHAHALVISFVI